MSSSLIDGVNAVANPDFVRRVASQLGEPVSNVGRGLYGGMTSLLGGLLAGTGDAGNMQGIFNLVTSGANDGTALDNPAALLDANAATSPLSALGGHFTTSVLGNRATAVIQMLSKYSGLRASVVSTLLRVAAPLVLGLLGRRVREQGLDAFSFTQSLETERDSIMSAAPAGLATALGTAERVPANEPRGAEAYTVPSETHRRRRFWPAVAVAGALALVWALWPKGHVSREQQRREAQAGGEVVAPIPAPLPPPGIPGVNLPGGTVIVVDPNSPESRIVGFIRGDSPTDKSSWFVLDRMQFETNSAKLSAESSEQIANLAKIMKAYPSTEVRIGGFTDNTGSEKANLKLSRERAFSVRRELVDAGVPAGRVKAEGFGSKNPIADNSTEEGRAQNRRIALLVTKK